MAYTPYTPFNVAIRLMVPTETVIKGTTKKVWPDPVDCPLIFGSLRTFSGSEQTRNDLEASVSTATIDTWYRPEITAACRLYVIETEETYEVVGDPEDIALRHQWMRIRVQRIGGPS